MTASLQGFQDRKIDPNTERPIHCPYCAVTYLVLLCHKWAQSLHL
jgi:hypothetical protein